MYDKPVGVLPMSIPAGVAGTSAGVAALSGLNLVWVLLALFALLAAGTAIMRIVPRNGEI
jgi:ABC-type transport system involved in cytochrome c biogenesis permease component